MAKKKNKNKSSKNKQKQGRKIKVVSDQQAPAQKTAKPAKQKLSVKDLADQFEKSAQPSSPHVLTAVTAAPKGAIDSIKERVSEHKSALKGHVASTIQAYKNDLDPDRLANFKKSLKHILTRGVIYIAISLVLAAGLVATENWLNKKIYLNTTIAGQDVSLKNIDAIKTQLNSSIQQYLSTPQTFSFEGKKLEIKPQDLGIKISLDQTLAQIPVYNFLQTSPQKILRTIFRDTVVTPVASYNIVNISKILDQQFKLTSRHAQNARMTIINNQLAITSEKAGIAINNQALAQAIDDKVASLSSDEIRVLTVAEQPTLTAQQLAQEKDRLTDLINQTVTLQSGKTKYKYVIRDHLDQLSFVFANSNSAPTTQSLVNSLTIQVDQDKLKTLLQPGVLKDLESQMSPVNIYTDSSGKTVIDGEGQDGKSVPMDQLAQNLSNAINNKIDTVEIPLVVVPGQVTISSDLQAQGIKQLISTGYTTFYGSHTNRIFNINVGIKRFNGVIIKPGEEFSFNTILGAVDASTGFRMEKVIKNDKVETEYGGGICQVSTTAYRAALFAGLPITQRRPHTWKLNYYSQVLGDGLDATIYIGGSNLKFVNDTPGSILIQSYADGMAAYFKFYGTDDGRKVVMDGPHGGGLSFYWYRTITNRDGQSKTETIRSQYSPMPTVTTSVAAQTAAVVN